MKNSDTSVTQAAEPVQEKKEAPKKSRAGILALKMVLFSCIVLAFLYFAGEWLYPHTGRAYTTMKRLKTATTSPDVMLLGSSTCFCDFNPTQFEQETGKSAMMLATSTQQLSESKAFLQEAIDQGTVPKTLFLFAGPIDRLRGRKSQYIVQVIETLPYNRNKLQLILDTPYTLYELPDLLFKAYRSREYYPQRIAELKSLLTPTPIYKEEYAAGDGYKAIKSTRFKEGSVLLTDQYSYTIGEATTPASEKQLSKIVELCRENNIDVIMIFPPRVRINIQTMNKSEDQVYNLYHKEAQAVADRYGIKFWDMNYVRPEYMTVTADMFTDSHHANVKLAETLTSFLGKLYTEYLDGSFDYDKYFMTGYEEFMATYPTVQGIYMHLWTNMPGTLIDMFFGLPADEPIEWKATIGDSKTGPFTLYQDWTKERKFLITEQFQRGKILHFEVRRVGSTVNEQDIYYKITGPIDTEN